MSDRGGQARTTKIGWEHINNYIYGYEYDANGNITKITRRDKTVANSTYETQQQFAYDELNQLIRADDLAKNRTEVYNYDNGGNILSTTVYPLTWGSLDGVTATKTTNYTYGDSNWKDKLTAYGNSQITYDAIGNPLTYKGYALTWQNGRQLASLQYGPIDISYTYDVDGLRTSKTVYGVEHKYYYVGNRLQYESIDDTEELIYFYDSDGNPSGIRYIDSGEATDYYFVCNWRGDVIQIYNATGTLVGNYDYDAWGGVTETPTSADTQSITETNPIRYRGYYYDTETKFYYLKSRYYDPAVKRFLNADGYIQTGDGLHDKNMFVYCLNNSVNLSDPTGQFPWIVVGAIVFIGVVGVIGGIAGYKSKEKLIDKPKTTPNGSNYGKQGNYNNDPKAKTNNSNSQNGGSASNNAETPELTSKDRAMNAFIGATLGMAAAGAVLALVGAGFAIGEIVIMGVTGAQLAAIGCLAFDAVAIIFAPFYSVEIEPIDWDYGY